MIKILGDEAIRKLTDHWNPLPSRLDGLVPEVIKLKLFQFVAQEAQRDTLEQLIKLSDSEFTNDMNRDFVWVSFRKKHWQEIKKQAEKTK